MKLMQQEKDELFSEFTIRYAEMDKADKRLNAAKNVHALKGMTRYYNETFNSCNANSRARKEQWTFYGCYEAYLKLRAAVPAMVNAKKYKGYNAYSLKANGLRFHENVLEEEDTDEATKVGKILLDAFIRYLTDGNE